MRIEIMSQMRAVAEAKRLTEKTAIVSITAPGQPPVRFEENAFILGIFRMCFWDIASPIPGHGEMKCPKQQDFDGLREFTDSMVREEVQVFLVHCAAGISRSAGVAAALNEYLGLHEEIFGNPDYFPNRLVYKLALNEFGMVKSKKYFEKIFSDQVSAMPATEVSYLNDPPKTIRRILHYLRRNQSVEYISRKTQLSYEITDKIVRICLTHPNATPEEILNKLGILPDQGVKEPWI